MRPYPAQGNIRPKISTMPRQKSEAAAFLDIYKLVIEKKRLQQELLTIEERRQQIHKRVIVLDAQIAGLEQSVQRMRDQEANPIVPHPGTAIAPVLFGKTAIAPTVSGSFDLQFLDY